IAQPNNAKLAAQVQLMFRGTTLRSMLLNPYAFGTMGMIAGIAPIAAFIAAAVMLVLGGLGLIHARRTSPGTDILTGHPAPSGDPAHNGHSGREQSRDEALAAPAGSPPRNPPRPAARPRPQRRSLFPPGL